MTDPLDFYLDPPAKTANGTLTIDALAPLSLSPTQPGSYYQSEAAPTVPMLLGMIENALGWHLDGVDARRDAVRALRKQAKKAHRKTEWATDDWLTTDPSASESGFASVLTYHLSLTPEHLPGIAVSYDDFWARHQYASASRSFFGGSRSFDAGLAPAIDRDLEWKRTGKAKAAKDEEPIPQTGLNFGDSAKHETLDPDALRGAPDGAKVHYKSVRPGFPTHYVSPAPRAYVVPDGPFVYRVETTPALARRIQVALDDPAAPLYLGSNDGWVEARFALDPDTP